MLLSRTKRWSSLEAWGMALAKRSGMPRAKVTVARKLAVVLLSRWRSDTEFRWDRKPAMASSPAVSQPNVRRPVAGTRQGETATAPLPAPAKPACPIGSPRRLAVAGGGCAPVTNRSAEPAT